MSLRREAAELKKALALSTQQVGVHPCSVSSGMTTDSHDFELRPVQLVPPSVDTPIPLPARTSYPVSPDNSPPPQKTTSSLSSRRHRDSSPDPIDSLSVTVRRTYDDIDDEPSILDGLSDIHSTFTAPFTPSVAPMRLDIDTSSASKSSTSKVNSSGQSNHPNSSGLSRDLPPSPTTSTRVSARVKHQKEKETLAKEERRKQRILEKERKLKENQSPQQAAETGESAPPGSGDKRKRKEKEPSSKRRKAESPLNTEQAVPTASTSSEIVSSPRRPTPVSRVVVVAPPLTKDHASTPVRKTSRSRGGSTSLTTTVPPSVAKVVEEELSPPPEEPEPHHQSAASPDRRQQQQPSAQELEDCVSTPPSKAIQSSGQTRSASDSTPGSSSTPNGRPWKTPRNDLSSVLSKFPGAKRTGMSRRTRIISLHSNIGPPKALPPPPPKPPNRKKVEEDDDDEEEEAEGKVKVGSREWLMMED